MQILTFILFKLIQYLVQVVSFGLKVILHQWGDAAEETCLDLKEEEKIKLHFEWLKYNL